MATADKLMIILLMMIVTVIVIIVIKTIDLMLIIIVMIILIIVIAITIIVISQEMYSRSYFMCFVRSGFRLTYFPLRATSLHDLLILLTSRLATP